MTEDVFSRGFQLWETRFKQSSPDQPPLQGETGREVQIAAAAYHDRYGQRPARAVDLGAGDGRHTLFLASMGFDVLAVDAASSGIELIRQKLEREALKAELVLADLREFELPEKIDLLVASYIIHLLPNPYETIQKWQEKVRPGGICSLSTRGAFPHDPDEYWFPQDFEIKRLFEKAGWLVLHAREEENWNPKSKMLFRQRAVVALKPD